MDWDLAALANFVVVPLLLQISIEIEANPISPRICCTIVAYFPCCGDPRKNSQSVLFKKLTLSLCTHLFSASPSSFPSAAGPFPQPCHATICHSPRSACPPPTNKNLRPLHEGQKKCNTGSTEQFSLLCYTKMQPIKPDLFFVVLVVFELSQNNSTEMFAKWVCARSGNSFVLEFESRPRSNENVSLGSTVGHALLPSFLFHALRGHLLLPLTFSLST